MKQNTIVTLLQVYTRLQQIAAELYEAAAALANNDFDDAGLLASRELSRQVVEADKINREQGRSLMLQARDTSKRYQILIQELKRQQA